MALFTTFEDAALLDAACVEPPLERVDAEEIVCRDARAIANFFDATIAPEEMYGYARMARPEEVVNLDETGRLLTLLFDAGQPGLTQLTALRRLRELFLVAMSDCIGELVAESEQ